MTVDWPKLAAPFPDGEVKQRQGPGGRMLSYVDARAVAQRLDDVLTPEGWQFTWTYIPGETFVKGHLDILGNVREDAGYPNSERDEEPLKAAVSDALKRCAVLFGIGRHLYDDNQGHSAVRAPLSRPAPPPVQTTPGRPHLVDTSVPSLDEPDWLAHHDDVTDDPAICQEHQVRWIGDGPSDWYHRKPEGGYCRHPQNKGKARAAR